ncbi:hypothetical protein LCGC14_1598920 [marine sediment metagenome]|uniref:Zinc-ribbon domain-containing protein n=1 Tax=marine sediment metagenome TaxID=412755 RepID=A0A0F9KSH9_9ZZZZ|nr:MAG: hypothetical protein Lokiarch_36300 [Candidatus Lokiarchaeum sp. GC14_75]
MAWIPIVVSSKKGCHRSSNISVIVGLLIFLVFGIMFFMLFNNFGWHGLGLSMPFVIGGFTVFLVVVICIASIASAMSKTYKTPKDNIFNRNLIQSKNPAPQPNPYIIQNDIKEQVGVDEEKSSRREIPVVGEVSFCRYCGSKIERDARFCHQCGSKL